MLQFLILPLFSPFGLAVESIKEFGGVSFKVNKKEFNDNRKERVKEGGLFELVYCYVYTSL